MLTSNIHKLSLLAGCSGTSLPGQARASLMPLVLHLEPGLICLIISIRLILGMTFIIITERINQCSMIKDFTLNSITCVIFLDWQGYLNLQIDVLREVKWFVCGHTAESWNQKLTHCAFLKLCCLFPQSSSGIVQLDITYLSFGCSIGHKLSLSQRKSFGRELGICMLRLGNPFI